MDQDRIYIESMTKVTDIEKNLAVRCWRHELNKDYNPTSNKREITEVLAQEYPTAYAAAEAVLEIDRMNAVEILDSDGNGVVLYKDWP